MSSNPRLLPFDDGAEKSVIGAILLRNSVIDDIQEILYPTDFFSAANRKLYEAAIEMRRKSEPIDEMTIWAAMGKQNVVKIETLMELAEKTPVIDNVLHYAQIVRDKANMRAAITTISELHNDLSSEKDSESALFNAYIPRLAKIAESRSVCHYHKISSVLSERINELQKRSAGGEPIESILTGLTDLDFILRGFRTGDLDILAGRPGMGKTSLAVTIMMHAAIEQQYPCAFFSLEQSKEDLTDKMLCIAANIPTNQFEIGDLTEQQWEKLAIHSPALFGAPIYIDDTSRTPGEIIAGIRKLVREYGIKFVVIDYLQNIKTDRPKFKSRDEDMGELVKDLHALAKELDVNILTLSQLNRSVESRKEKQPAMSDLRESGNLEQTAYRIILMYRDDYYNDDSAEGGIAQLIIAKNKRGTTGTVPVKWIAECTKFGNLTRY